MFNRQYLVASLALFAAPIVLCGAAVADEVRPATTRVTSHQESMQQVVNEVSRPGTSRRRAVASSRRHAHWKTRYWNQHSTKRTGPQR